MKSTLPLLILLAAHATGLASLSVTIGNSPVVVTFDSSLADVANGQFAGSGFQSAPTVGQLDSDSWAFTGWSSGTLAFGGTQTTASTDFTRGTVTTAQSTGGIYAFGSTDRQLLLQPGGSDWAPGTMTLRVANNTGIPISEWNVSYDLFVRNDQDRSSSFNFSYSTDGTNFVTTNLTDALFTYTSVAALDALGYVEIGTPSATITPLVADGGNLFLRWSSADVGGTGFRDEFAIDNISVTAVPEPASALLVSLGIIALLRRRR